MQSIDGDSEQFVAGRVSAEIESAQQSRDALLRGQRGRAFQDPKGSVRQISQSAERHIANFFSGDLSFQITQAIRVCACSTDDSGCCIMRTGFRPFERNLNESSPCSRMVDFKLDKSARKD